jgi:hypothetical protein
MGRVIRGNGRKVIAWMFGPDAQSRQLATAMAVNTNTASPASVGVHGRTPGMGGASRMGYVGDRGYGVNRFAGRTDPLQFFAGAAAAIKPIADPRSRRLGVGAMTAGQPGLPNTGMDQPGTGSLAWLGPTASLGYGG